ncbi:MAG: hypothetical protein ABIW31_06885 [Novosphingobium sp.]
MNSFRAISLTAGVALVGAVSWPIIAQQHAANSPVARYDIRAGTVSGVGAMGRGGMGMAAMFGGGGGNNVQHELYLRLGSAQPPAGGAPHADHFMPPAARLGKSVPLLTPQSERAPVDQMPGDGTHERPKGRMLIFWGCGEHAAKGQPIIIDFSKLAAGQMPAGMWSTTIVRDWGPSLQNSKTFGRWPNEDSMGGNRNIRPDASLIGAHRIAGNYSPDINFSLTKDFMAALSVSTGSTPGGGSLLRWNAVPEATGYFASLFGGKGGQGGMGDMVMWSSSMSRQFGGGLDDWLSPAQVSGLVRDRVVMPSSQTTCIVPSEVRAATEFRMGRLIAYGPDENFAFPARPADPKKAWILQWTARIRHRSLTSWMDIPGMPGGGFGSGEDSESDQPRPPSSRPRCKPRGGLGGMIGGVLSGGAGC